MSRVAALRVGGLRDHQLSAWPALAPVWAAMVGLSGGRRLLAAAALGAVGVLAMPPVHFVPALIPSLAGFLWLLQGVRGRWSLIATAFAFGLGHFTAGLYWVAYALLTRPEEFGWLAPAAPLGLALILAPFLIVPAAATRLARRGSVGEVIVFAAAWAFAEWLRSWVGTGFPWNLVGTVWTFWPPMLQISAVTGVYGLSLITVLAAAMPAVLGGPCLDRRRAWAAVGLMFALLASCGIGGAVRLAGAGDCATVEGVRLRLVQPNISQAIKWRADLVDRHLLDQAELGALDTGTPPTHVVWSEAAAPLLLADDSARRAVVAERTPVDGLSLIGTLRRTGSADAPEIRNSLIAIDHTGAVVASYDKAHLVPFGEYMPLGRVLGLSGVVGLADLTAGPGVRTLSLPGLPPVSPLICYEVIFPGAVVDRWARPAWLLNITNDGWYGLSAGPYQHLAAAQMRAVEEGLPLVRVANTGISAVVDPYGRVLRSLALGTRGILDTPLPVALAAVPPFARTGTIPILAIILALIPFGAYVIRRT